MHVYHITGGWSVLKDFDFNQWDKDFTMVQLHSKYSVDLFFKINVVPDDRAAGKYIIQVLGDYIIHVIRPF